MKPGHRMIWQVLTQVICRAGGGDDEVVLPLDGGKDRLEVSGSARWKPLRVAEMREVMNRQNTPPPVS